MCFHVFTNPYTLYIVPYIFISNETKNYGITARWGVCSYIFYSIPAETRIVSILYFFRTLFLFLFHSLYIIKFYLGNKYKTYFIMVLVLVTCVSKKISKSMLCHANTRHTLNELKMMMNQMLFRCWCLVDPTAGAVFILVPELPANREQEMPNAKNRQKRGEKKEEKEIAEHKQNLLIYFVCEAFDSRDLLSVKAWHKMEIAFIWKREQERDRAKGRK